MNVAVFGPLSSMPALLAAALCLPLITPLPAHAQGERRSKMDHGTGISVTRQEEEPVAGQGGWVMAQSYAALRGGDLLRAIEGGDKCWILRSTDNGQTWPGRDVAGQDAPAGPNLTRHTSVDSIYLDPANGLLVRFLSEVVVKSGAGIVYGDATEHGPHTVRLYYQVSRDGGRTWEPAQQLIEKGEGYDAMHWARDGWYGRSSLCIEGQQPHRLKNGLIVIPAYLWPSTEYMAGLFEEQRWPAELRRDAPYFVEGRCLLARWRRDRSGLEFVSGGPMRLAGGYTPAGTCGSDEAAVAYLDEKHWFAVVRTSTGHVDDFRQRGIPLTRQCLATRDGGLTWRPNETLRFDDGSPVLSPSAWSQFIRSSRTRRWYWIGNILEQPTYGTCDPRYPLQIVELDARTLRLKKATVTIIQDKEPADDKWVRFSNFRVYEERGTGDFILLMRKSYCELAPPGLPGPFYRYRVRFATR